MTVMDEGDVTDEASGGFHASPDEGEDASGDGNSTHSYESDGLSDVDFGESEYEGGTEEDEAEPAADDPDGDGDGGGDGLGGGGWLRREEVARLERFVYEASVPLENRFYCPNKERGCGALFAVVSRRAKLSSS